jgi:hypothetical protein
VKTVDDRAMKAPQSAAAAQDKDRTPGNVSPQAISQSPRVAAQRQFLGSLHGRFSPSLAMAQGRGPVQRFKKQYPGKRDEASAQWQQAAPFQLATVQFEAAYDINAYSSELKDYAERCLSTQSIPVIDFRYYDAAFQVAIDAYHLKARSQLEPILGTTLFDITFSLLRDETMSPPFVNGQAEAKTKELQEVLTPLTDLDISKDQTGKKFIMGNGQEKKEKLAALNKPASKMLSGDMMVPVPEAFEFMSLPPEQLKAVFAGTTQTRYSTHHRLLAGVLSKNREQKQPVHTDSPTNKKVEELIEEPVEKEVKQELGSTSEGPLRLRSNSGVRPDTLTLTNLVTGDESQNLASTLQACEAAFAKGASQVLLIIEEVPDKASGKTRPALQIEALQEAGYDVQVLVTSGLQALGRAEQSGVKLHERTSPIPPRWKVRVSGKG